MQGNLITKDDLREMRRRGYKRGRDIFGGRIKLWSRVHGGVRITLQIDSSGVNLGAMRRFMESAPHFSFSYDFPRVSDALSCERAMIDGVLGIVWWLDDVTEWEREVAHVQ